MESKESKLKIKDAINMCSYPKNIRQEFAKFLESTYGSQKHKLYIFSRNETAPKLFLLQLQLPAKFNNQSYDISLLVYFPINFPEIEPEIFFEKIGKVKINPNCTFYIDEDTLKVNYSLFFTWEKSFDSFKALVTELYTQFNIAFPVFNLSDKNKKEEDDGDQSDCVLKKNLCKEVELIRPPLPKKSLNNYQKNNNNNNQNSNYNNNQNNNNYNYNNQDMNNKMNNMSNAMNNMNINNNNNNMNNNNMNNYRNNFNNRNANNNMNNNNNMNSNYNNNRNYGNNPMMNQNNNPPPFDENRAKMALINLLKNNLGQKINNSIQPIMATSMQLEKIKENIIKKIRDFDKVENKENAIRQTINTLYKEMDFTITSPKEIDKPDLSNLESVLIISNKDYYLRLAKEKAIEEYILVVKKCYEKQNIDFSTALNLIRTNSRNIFFLKYKNANPFNC